MEARRLFSSDPTTGTTKWWHYDPDTDKAYIETVQDCSSLCEIAANAERESRGKRFGDFLTHVSFIPMATYSEWLSKGCHKDQKVIRKWLNDPENRLLRTKHCRV